MRKETKIALLVGAGSFVAGTGFFIAAGVAAMGFGITALIAKKIEIKEEEISYEPIEPQLFARSLNTLSEQTIPSLSIPSLNLEQCYLLIKKISELSDQGQTYNDLKKAFDKVLLRYINLMIKMHEQNPSFFKPV